MAYAWIIYGANGYTGRLIAEEARRRRMTPMIAGRSESKIRPLAEQLSLPWRCFPLDDAEKVAREIADARIVLNCAGPFSATAEVMINACLSVGAHYLDITGEIDVFEYAHSRNDDARSSGVALCPGVGFDVIPTDCVAARLKEALPDTTQLALGFDTRSGQSTGTAKTTVERLPDGGAIRKDGKIHRVPLGYRTRHIDFGDGEKLAVTIPWGDVATAYYTTSIPNVETYIPVSRRMLKTMRRLNWIRPLLGMSWVQKSAKARIEKKISGPGVEQREETPTFVWGEAKNDQGETRTARIRVANGYTVTVNGALAIVDIIQRHRPPSGYLTPSQLAGASLIEQLPESGSLQIS